MRSPKAGKSSWLLLGLLVVVVDQWSKQMVEVHLPLHVPYPVIPGFLNLTHVQNTGVAFGLLAANGDGAATALLTLLGLLALTVVGVYFWRTPSQERLMLAALALILGGAIGNLIDRIAAGAVTDFVDAYYGSYHWHTFNVADSAITVGICLMVLEILLPRRRATPPGGAADDSPRV